MQPDLLPALNQAAWVLATCAEASVRNGTEAVTLASRAAEITGGREPNILDSLAAAYAETGRFEQAVETARRALALALTQDIHALAEEIRARVALYESRQPFRSRP